MRDSGAALRRAAILPFRRPATAVPARQDLTTLHARRGYHVAYRPGDPQPCPGCRRSHWHVGRLLAECAFCGTALPLEGAAAGGEVV